MLRCISTVAVLFSVLTMATDSKGIQGKPRAFRFHNFRKFLKTSEPIWTYNSAFEEYFNCQVDVVTKLGPLSVRYNRSYIVNKEVRTDPMEGWFIKERRDEMFVGVRGNIPIIAEKLAYVSQDKTCAVVKVFLPFPGLGPWADLRVKNSSILIGPSKNCSDYFNRAYNKEKNEAQQTKGTKKPSQGKPIYNPECQKILERPPWKGDEHL